MAKYERYFPELKNQLTEFEDRVATLMQYTSWDLQKQETLAKLKDAAAELKKMAIKENGNVSETPANAEGTATDTTADAAGATAKRLEWEYTTGVYEFEDKITGVTLRDKLNKFGELGWELVHVFKDEEKSVIRLVFKRPKV